MASGRPSVGVKAAIKVTNDSCQQDHGIGGSPGRARNRDKRESWSSILATNVVSQNAQTTTWTGLAQTLLPDRRYLSQSPELPQGSVETNSQVDWPLQLEELYTALQSMQGWKAPGINGLTVEFGKAFWDVMLGRNLEFKWNLDTEETSWILWSCAVLYYIALHCLLYCSVLYCTVSSELYGTALHPLLYCSFYCELYYTILYCSVLYYLLYCTLCAVLYCTALLGAILESVEPLKKWINPVYRKFFQENIGFSRFWSLHIIQVDFLYLQLFLIPSTCPPLETALRPITRCLLIGPQSDWSKWNTANRWGSESSWPASVNWPVSFTRWTLLNAHSCNKCLSIISPLNP